MARVLLVDDDIAEISAVKRVLARYGHLPVLATNAADGLAAVARARPDLLVVASSCDGGEALRRFGEDEGARGIPVLVLGDAPGGAPHVARPVDPAELADQVAQSLAGGLASAARAATPPQRAAPSDPAPSPARRDPDTARKAAAEALRARADELRKVGAPVAAAAPPAPRAPEPAPTAAPELEDSGLEAILKRAEEAERAHAAEKKARARQADRATVEAAQRAEAERIAVEKAARARAAEERARAEQRARAEAEEKAKAEAAARARAEDAARASEEAARAREEAERRAADEARAREQEERRAADGARAREQEERRAADEARARAEEERRGAEEEARRAAEAEARARAEADARLRLEDELESLRGQVEAERRNAEERIHSVMERAAAEERAAEDERRRSEEEARRRESEEEGLRRAIASARAEMESLRRRGEDEARRRADAEAEVARLAREAERRAAEAAALPRPFDFPSYAPPKVDPAPDAAEEAARKRVAMLKERATAREEPAADGAAVEVEAPRRVRPPPPELRAGTLLDVPAPRLLALAGRAETTGRLDVEGEVARSVWLEDGRIVGAASADPLERVEELALRLGLVTRDQHRQVAAAAATLASRRAALLLLERGFLKPTELTALVRRRTEEVVFGIFADDAARFRWAPAEVPPDERTALERTTLALAVEGVRRRWLAPRVDAVLGGAGTLLAPVEGAPSAADLALSPGERRAVALADGLRTVDEIVAGSPLDPLSTRQVLAALVLVGALAVRMFQGGRPAAAATAAIDLARVREKLEQARRADYFTVLGIGRLCTPHEVREASERLAAEFDPRRFQGVHEEGLDGRLEEIRRVVADAREILVDDRLRVEYLRGLGE